MWGSKEVVTLVIKKPVHREEKPIVWLGLVRVPEQVRSVVQALGWRWGCAT